MAFSDKGAPGPPAGGDLAHTAPAQRRVFAGRYSIEREVVRPGVRILAARDLRIGRSVMLKIFAGGSQGEEERRRFEEEARIAGAVNHPGIHAIYDVGEHAGESYVVSELLEGETLREALSAGPMVPEEVLDLGTQLAGGLAAAHRKGIVHGALKPNNLFITDDGRLKILDFGAIHPEQPADARTDVFALGGVLQEMLAGRPGSTNDSTRDPGFQGPDAQLPRIVERCLQADPAARYANAGEVLEDLDAIAREKRREAWRRSRVRTTVIAAAMLASAVAMALIVKLYVLPRREAAAKGPQVLAVLPFTVRGSGQNTYLGEGMVDLLSITLAGQTLHALEPSALLSELERERWNGDPERGRRSVSRLGATRFVLGSIVEVGPRLRIHASLYDARRDGTPLRDAKVEGESARIFDLVDDLTAQLRERPANAAPGERASGLAEVTTASVPALRAYLEGLQEVRRQRTSAAHAAFERAVAADPAFALGRQRLSETAEEAKRP